MQILYHGGCTDGFCAAYIAKQKYPAATLVPCYYGTPAPSIVDKDLLVLDFSWPREETIALATANKSIRIFDHHETAQKNLEGLPYAIFDMERSGAGLVWDYLYGKDSKKDEFCRLPRPWYVNYVEDADLWRWELRYSRLVSNYFHVLPHTTEAWDRLTYVDWLDAKRAGATIQLYIDRVIAESVKRAQMGYWWNCRTAVVNMASDSLVGEALCNTRAEIALMYAERQDGKIVFGLRSANPMGPDVGSIAKDFAGGGGHKHAAGFELPYKDGRNLIDRILGRA